MDRLGSLFWSGMTALALLGMLASIAGPTALAGPIVRITEPSHGQVVQSQILINVAFRTDSNQPITRLELLIDEGVVRQYVLATPRLEGSQSFSWDFTTQAGSTHNISARAIDAAGEVGSATISVTVTGATTVGSGGQDRVPPVINIYYPAQGAELSGEVEVKAEASDNVGVRYVFFYIDGKLHKMIMNAPPFVDLWDTARVPDGPHVLQARAMDESENAGTSAEVTVFVRNHDMTTAPGETLQPYGSTQTPPPVGTQPTVTRSQFADVQDEQPTLMAVATDDDAHAAPVGYVPAIGDDRAAARTSQPRLLAAAEFSPRLTAPQRLPEEGLRGVSTLPEGVGADQPFGPQLAAIEATQRTTMPRTDIERLPSTAAGVILEPGWVVVEPCLQVSPAPERLAARTTTPIRSLAPSEALAVDTSSADTIVTPSTAEGELGTVVGLIEPGPRTTVPARALGDFPALSFGAIDDAAGTTRIAVLPERAARAAIPADGRVTRPGEPAIAPVASMSFEDVAVLFDSETLELLTQPEARDGISIAPLREIFEHSDGVLYWYPIEKRVRAVRPGTDIHIQIGDAAVQVNEDARVLQVAPYIKHGRTMVPLQFIADTLNVTVTFNPATGQICLTSNDF